MNDEGISHQHAMNECAHLRAINADLVAAIEPFANRATVQEIADDVFVPDNYGLTVTMGECRTARAALAKARG